MEVVFDLEEWDELNIDDFLDLEISIHVTDDNTKLLITSEKHTIILNELSKSLLELIERGGVNKVFGVDKKTHLKLERDNKQIIIIIYNDFLDQADTVLIYDLFEFSQAYFEAVQSYLTDFDSYKKQSAPLQRLEEQLKIYISLTLE